MSEAYDAPTNFEHPGIQLLEDELRAQAKHPPGNEPAIGAFCAAALERSGTGGDLRPVLNDMLLHRAPVTTESYSPENVHKSEYIGVLRSTVVTHQDSLNPLFDYSGSTTTQQWDYVIDDFLAAYNKTAPADQGGVSAKQLYYMLFERNVATSVPSRYYTAELVAQLLNERFTKPVRMLDVGASVGLAKYLLHKSAKPMAFESVTNIGGDTLTDATNSILSRDQVVDELVCVDIQDALNPAGNRYSPHLLRWYRGSKRPSERDDTKHTLLDRRLLSAKIPGVSHVTADLGISEQYQDFKSKNSGGFQLATMNTMLHQMPPSVRQNLLQNAIGTLADNGALLVQDFATLPGVTDKPQPTDSLKMLASWHDHDWPYRLFVYDNAQKQKGFQELALASDSRNRTLQLATGKIAVGSKLWTLEERIKHVTGVN